MPQASRSIVIDVTPDQFLSVVQDYESYPQFLPEIKKLTVANKTATSAEVSYEIDVIKRIHYTLKLERADYKITWRLMTSDLLKKNEGSWELKAEAGGAKTHATYNLELAIGGFIPVPSAIINKLSEQSLPGLLNNFKRRAESLFPKTA
jgi:coenzyme Q-binding protein COQ10